MTVRRAMAAVADIGIRIDADVPIRRDRRSACRDEDREIVSTLTMQSLPWRKAGRLASSQWFFANIEHHADLRLLMRD